MQLINDGTLGIQMLAGGILTFMGGLPGFMSGVQLHATGQSLRTSRNFSTGVVPASSSERLLGVLGDGILEELGSMSEDISGRVDISQR